MLQCKKELKIVYTPFNGTGNVPARRILKEVGFENVIVVPEQEMPDPNFTTLEYPNPEDPKAFTLALKLAKEVGADIVLATDPDADRLGIYAYDTKTGDYVSFTGNMSGMLIADYILRERKATGTMPADPMLVKTIVTTNMADRIVEKYGVDLGKLEFFGLEYREIARYLKGECTPEEMRRILLDRIRQFAKRQDIFFRKIEREGHAIHWIPQGDFSAALALARRFLSGEVLPPPAFRLADHKN